MKKVLIMTASTGGGHNRAARAIIEELEKRTYHGHNIECKIIDSFKLVSTAMDKQMVMKYQPSIHHQHMAVCTSCLTGSFLP